MDSGASRPSGDAPEHPATPPAALQDRGTGAAALAAREAELSAALAAARARLASAAAAAAAAATARLGARAAAGALLPEGPAALLEELEAVHAVREYASFLSALSDLARDAERAARAAERAAAGGDPAAAVRAAAAAAGPFGHAQSYVAALEALAAGGRVPAGPLRRRGAGLAARVAAAGGALRAVLNAAAAALLEACGWPPPLAGSAAAAAGWDGLAAPEHAPALAELQHALSALLTLQRAAEHAAFAALAAAPASAEGPPLWPAAALLAAPAAALRRHFASGLPTDRADRPEWLFAAALGAARAAAPAAEALQPAVDAHCLGDRYALPLEAARAAHEAGVAPLLRAHVLPRLVALDDPGAWLHYTDAAVKYEAELAPLRGAAPGGGAAEPVLAAAAARPGSAIEVLFEDEAWAAGWLAAEAWDAARQLEAACEAPGAWGAPAGAALAGGDAAACRHEFWPPACAEAALALADGLAGRAAWIAAPAHQERFLEAAPLAVLRDFRARLAALLARAEQFRDPLSDAWLPRVGAALCAAHAAEHAAREPAGALLGAELGAPGAAALGAVLSREADALSALRRRWALKLAAAGGARFEAALAPYAADGARFAAGAEAGAPPAGPSPRLLLAAHALQALLRALGAALDAVAFRDAWRALALAANRALFNGVVVEAAFSRRGAALLAADVACVAAAFAGCAPRPNAHFRESAEAAALLALPRAEAAALGAALRGPPAAAAAALAAAGARSLSTEQAEAVLARRLEAAGDS
jgi:hypothetical protein